MNQFGRLVLVYEDRAGFIVHHFVLPRDAQDADVVIDQTRIVQNILGNAIEEIAFDRGFYSPENQQALEDIVSSPCLPAKGTSAYADQMKNASVAFRNARRRHAGVESAIGALQSGNGLDRCRDRTEMGFERYLALAMLGRVPPVIK